MNGRRLCLAFCIAPLLLGNLVLAQSQLKVGLSVPDPEVAFGQPFTLEFELQRSSDLDIEAWTDDRFSPLVLKRLSSTTASEGDLLIETYRYEARLFRRGAATVRPTAWRGFPAAGGEVVVAECSPLLLFVKSSLDLADPGPVEMIDDLKEEPALWAFAAKPLVFWSGLAAALAALFWFVYLGVLWLRRPARPSPFDLARKRIDQGRAAGDPALPLGADLIRDYLQAEFQLAAPLKTTSESLALLREDARLEPDLINRLEGQFEAADRRKFMDHPEEKDLSNWSEIEETLETLRTRFEEDAARRSERQTA